MKTIFSAAFIILCFVAWSCKNSNTSKIPSPDSPSVVQIANKVHVAADTAMLEGTWYLQPVLASDAAGSRTPVVTFNVKNKTFSGSTGCNKMSGHFMVTDSTIAFDQNMILTKMACPGYNEKAFVENLLRINNYKFEKDELLLMVDVTIMSRWKKQPPSTPTQEKS